MPEGSRVGRPWGRTLSPSRAMGRRGVGAGGAVTLLSWGTQPPEYRRPPASPPTCHHTCPVPSPGHPIPVLWLSGKQVGLAAASTLGHPRGCRDLRALCSPRGWGSTGPPGAALAHLAPPQSQGELPWAGGLCVHPGCAVAGRVLPAAGPQQQQHPTREGFLLGGPLALAALPLGHFSGWQQVVCPYCGIFILTPVCA